MIYDPNGILVMDIQDKTLDDSTEEGELKGISTSEVKLRAQNSDINQVIGEGIMFTSRYLLRMISDRKVDSEHVVSIKAYLIWVVFSGTIRFYSLKADFDTRRYTLVQKGVLHHNSFQSRRLGQYLTLLLKKLKTP